MLKITTYSKDWKESWDFNELKRVGKLVGKRIFMCEIQNDYNDSNYMIIYNQNLQQHQCQAFFDNLEMLICDRDVWEAKNMGEMLKLAMKVTKEFEQ